MSIKILLNKFNFCNRTKLILQSKELKKSRYANLVIYIVADPEISHKYSLLRTI